VISQALKVSLTADGLNSHKCVKGVIVAVKPKQTTYAHARTRLLQARVVEAGTADKLLLLLLQLLLFLLPVMYDAVVKGSHIQIQHAGTPVTYKRK
jgi:hypothetical protein